MCYLIQLYVFNPLSFLAQKEVNPHGAQAKADDLIWLDSIQSKIINSGNPRQLIIGPASSGKTLLIQLKVLDLFRRNKASKCLIILPFKQLVQKYQNFFQFASIQQKVCFTDFSSCT